MKCNVCESTRILEISAKVSDRGCYELEGKEIDGYAPEVANICGDGGDYIFPDICLDCGQTQGDFPVEYLDEFEEDE